MAQRLEGRVVIVTGGGHGIGKVYCRALAREGARVVVAEIDGKAADATADSLHAEGADALAVVTDVADETSTRELARVPLDEISVEEWDRVMAVNLRGVFLACKAVLPEMKARGSGRIINIASGTVFSGPATRIHYVTSKAGVLGFTRTLAREVGTHGITVNTIAPGSTLSEENPTEELKRFRQSAIQGRAIPRLQVPDDLVGAVIFFASDESAFITGQTLVVDG